MTDEYLWSRAGVADPDVVQLERILGRLAFAPERATLPRWRLTETRQPHRASWRFFGALVATTAAAIALVLTVARQESSPTLEVTALAGTPTLASHPVSNRNLWLPGRWLETGADARANIDIENVGRVEIAPDTRIGLLRTRPGDYRLNLAHGSMQAVIWAPPGQVSVATPSSTAVDLGCVYSMTMDDDGTGLIEVAVGWVGFEWNGRESFIPAGATCPTRPRLGPGTPRYPDTSDAFRAALEVIDTSPVQTPARTAAVNRVIAEARARDAVTLWHLLSRVDGADRDRVFDALARLVPPPSGVTREAIRAGDRQALDRWWDALDLGTAAWWRIWQQRWRESPAAK